MLGSTSPDANYQVTWKYVSLIEPLEFACTRQTQSTWCNVALVSCTWQATCRSDYILLRTTHCPMPQTSPRIQISYPQGVNKFTDDVSLVWLGTQRVWQLFLQPAYRHSSADAVCVYVWQVQWKMRWNQGVCLCRVPIQLQMLWAVSHGRNSMMVQMCQNQLMACKLSRRRQMNNM
jgi:hypothetical protein